MESAALTLIALKLGVASSLGVMFGWQPMPFDALKGGRPKVEYIVQIEPELAATLQSGQSIPITSDIPEDIGPIGRIRIVVGRDELPRQKLTTQFKPWPKNMVAQEQAPEGLLETQYRVEPVEPSGGSRYPASETTAANSILPPTNDARMATNPLGRALQQGAQKAQQGAQKAKNLAAGVRNEILPPADQIFGSRGDRGQGVQAAINNTATQLQHNLQQGVNRGVKHVAEQVGQHARQAIDQFSQPATTERSVVRSGQNQPGATILPLGNQAGGSPMATQGQRIDEPVQQRQNERWQRERTAPPANFAAGSPPPRINPTSQQGTFNAPWPPIASHAAANNTPPRNDNSNLSAPPSTAPHWSNTPPANASQPPRRYPTAVASSNNGVGMEGMGAGSVSGPSFPPPAVYTVASPAPAPQTAVSQLPMASPPARHTVATPNADALWPNDVSGPAIRRDMMLEQRESTPANDKTLFPLLFSWVLLSGSGVGNAYLWWSYLDVRNKYQGVVHGSPRRHRDRYDD